MGLSPVQRKAAVDQEAVQRREGGAQSADHVQEAAATGVSGAGSQLPHHDRIQQLFGRHDVSGIQAHVGGPAATASDAIGASAYATGSQVAFRDSPDLHTAAHEAAHVVQQRGGVQLKGGVGEAGDRYEQHADAVADRVVRGESAEGMLDAMAGGSTASPSAHGPVQRKEGPGANGATGAAQTGAGQTGAAQPDTQTGGETWQQSLARWVTSGAEAAHEVYDYFADLAAKSPESQAWVNVQLGLAKAAAGGLVDINPATVSWVGLGAMWLFELGQNPIEIGDGAVTTLDLKHQEGVQRVRDLAREEAGKGTLTQVQRTWVYGQKEFYDGLKQGNIATSFLGSYATQVSLSSQTPDSVTIDFEVNNTTSWESGTRLRKAAKPGGPHQAIIPSRARGSGGIALGGNFTQIWRWSETLPRK
jgi:hypothetical protein